MPTHSSTKLHGERGSTSTKTKSKSSAAGGAERVGGKKVNGGAAKAFSKNQDAAADYLYALETAADLSALAAIRKSSLLIARVSANTGSGVKVILETQTGAKAEPVFVPFAKSIRFHGHAATKTDRVNCMCAHDIVLVDGGFARAKFSPAGRLRLRTAFSALGATLPAGFFAPPPAPAAVDAEDADDEDVIAGNLRFDRTEQTEEEAAAEAERVADAAARARKNRTADARGRAVARDDVRAAMMEQLAALQARRGRRGRRAEPAEEEAEPAAEEDAESEDEDAPGGAAAGASRSAPNRAERRAAKLARLDLAARKARCITLQEEVDAALAVCQADMGTPEELAALLAKSTKTLEFLREERAAIREEEELAAEEAALRAAIAEQERQREAEMEAEIRATRGFAELPEAGDWEAYVDAI
jgi:hypothetical protein